MVPAARPADPRPMAEGRHVAFTLHAGGARSRCVRFGAGARLDEELVDAAVRLEANRWNGAIEPRLVLRHARLTAAAAIDILGEPSLADGIEAARLDLAAARDAKTGDVDGRAGAEAQPHLRRKAALHRLPLTWLDECPV